MRPLIAKRPASSARPDPAPSRAAYRMQRLMLTPAYRLTLRVLVPFVVSMGLVALYMSNDARRDAIILGLQDLRNDFETRPEFMVRMMAVEGATGGTEADIREIAQLDFPISTFDLDLDALRRSVEDLPAVAEAAARIRQKGVLEVSIIERAPVALWRTRDGIDVLDIEGIAISAVQTRADRPDLPVIAGYGADRHVAEAVRLINIMAPMKDRLRGLVRVGERRWDVILSPDLRIMLPQDRPDFALERVIALHEAQDVLNRDLAAVDMRIAARPTLRMNAHALDQWRKVHDWVVETGN
ncbi:cell division protein FtsQ/DivIB [Pseudooceanicola atlanticus]|uniref:Cell division protein FtsQ n=1 Tax=Pseudooceanicola atlanticus TaxID=1461694 RepID=A0A0A0EES6_9RHOB|nr:cell division protein FtsQ/DivIB [Pseudooceanicola atlanticus]KGM48608.1 cell division protein FtsQ [Pseudooceanicola atlanticus]